jgi:hypothetical protein
MMNYLRWGLLGLLLVAATSSLNQAVAGSIQVAASAAPDDDLGVALQHCVDQVGDAGGECDLRSASKRTISAIVRISKNNIKILLPPGTISLGRNARIEIMGSGIVMEGLGKSGTTLLASGDTGIVIGDANSTARRWRLKGFTVGGTPASVAGIRFESAREGRIDDVAIVNFKSANAAGLVVGNNCWTVVIDDVNITSNQVGVLFHGSNTNAWVFRSSNISSNAVGVDIDLGRNSAHGIYFLDATHFEENTTAAIRMDSGDIYSLVVSDPYIELREGQRFAVARGSQAARLHVMSFMYSGGFLTSAGTLPFDFDTSASPDDTVTATIQGLYVMSKVTTQPVVRAAGTGTRTLIVGGGFAGRQPLSLPDSFVTGPKESFKIVR